MLHEMESVKQIRSVAHCAPQGEKVLYKFVTEAISRHNNRGGKNNG